MSVTAEAPARRDGRRWANAARFAFRFGACRRGVVGLSMTVIMVATAVFADWIAPGNPLDLHEPALMPPSREHLMGTDNLGREMFVAVVHGVRVSLTVAFWVVLISAVLGICLGALAGYRRGLVDDALMRLTEFFQVIPRFFLALLVASMFGRGIRVLILLLGFTSWTMLARVVRAETLSLRQREFVEAARAYGASDMRIIRRHIIPNVLPGAIVLIALQASRVVLIESSLSFLGLGDPRQIGLGYLVSNANAYLEQAWWLSVFPGAALAMIVLGFNLLADGLNTAIGQSGPPGRQRSRPNRLRRASASLQARPSRNSGSVMTR